MQHEPRSLRVNEVVVELGNRRSSFVLGPISLAVSAGEVVGLVGPNGSGKSTLYNLLCGLLRPDSGTIRYGDIDSCRNEVVYKQKVGFVSDFSYVYSSMTVRRAISFARCFYADQWSQEDCDQMLSELRLPEDRPVKALSKGMKTKLSLILALSSNRRCLVLDEPTSGLDQASVEWFWRWVHGATARGCGVFVSLHSPEQVVSHCDRVLALSDGSLYSTFDLRNGPADAVREIKELMAKVGESS